MAITVNLPDSVSVTLPKGFAHEGATQAAFNLSSFTSEMIERVVAFGLKEYLNNACAAKEANVATALKAIARVGDWARSAPAARSGLPTADRLFIAGVRQMLRGAPFAVKSETMKTEVFAMPDRAAAVEILKGEIALARVKAGLDKPGAHDREAIDNNLAKRVSAIDESVKAQIAAMANAATGDLD